MISIKSVIIQTHTNYKQMAYMCVRMYVLYSLMLVKEIALDISERCEYQGDIHPSRKTEMVQTE